MIRTLALTTALLLGSTVVAQARDLEGALAFLPADVSTVVAIDIESTRGTNFFKDMQKELVDLSGYGREMAQLKKDTGIDVMADAKLVVYAGPDELIKKAKESLVIVEGSFDPAKLKDFLAKKSKLPVVEKQGAGGTYYAVGDKAAFAFRGTFAVYGSTALFDKAIAAQAAGGGKTKVQALVNRFKGATNGFAVVGGSGQLKKFLGKSFGDVQDVKSAGITFDFTKGVAIQVVGIFADAGKASAVAASLEKDLKKTAADPEYQEVGLDKVTIKSSGAEVTMSLVAEGAAGKALSKSLKELFSE